MKKYTWLRPCYLVLAGLKKIPLSGGASPFWPLKGVPPPPPEIVNILKSKAHRLSKLIKLKVSSRNLSTIISDLDGFQSVNLRSDDDRNRKDNDTCLSLKISSRGSQWG